MAAPRTRKPGKKTGTPRAEGGRSPSKDGREFVAEAEEILEQLCSDLCLLHEQRHAGGEIDPELVHRLFRSAHTLKGLAGLFGVEIVSRLAHRLEDVLDGLRLGRIDARAPVVGMLDDGVALLVASMTSAASSEADVDADAAADADPQAAAAASRAERFLADLDRALATPPPTAAGDLDTVGLDPTMLRALTEYEEHRLRESLRKGRPIVLIDATFELASFEDGLAEISAAVRESGEIISTLPSAAAAADRRICFTLLVATDLDPDHLGRRIDNANATLRVVHPGRPAARPAASPAVVPAAAEGAVAPTSGDAGPVAAEESAPEEGPRIESLRSVSGSVRVDIAKLDRLMNQVGELLSHRNALGQLVARLAADGRNARLAAELAKVQKVLDRRLKELQASVLDVRMVPLRQVFEKLSRVVRRLRIDLDKPVELEFKGGDTELDKLLVEQLVDPMVHVVRNAFDHAIESPAEREAAGKPAIGRIEVAALQRGNHVVVEVVDDGRGIDVEALRRKAVERGIVAEGEVLSERDALHLIFEAGLSTRTSVSTTSGRGVGMDVVRSNLASLGGLVEVASVAGQGTTITITLPITLAIIQALIVRVGGERFAIPLASVRETLRVEEHPILRSEDRELLNLRGEPLPLRRLADEFEISSEVAPERQFVVVLGLGEQRLGLVVDGFLGQQDIVIKPIKGPIQTIRGVAGATEIGDRVALLVIDVSALMVDASRRREAA